MQLMISAGGTGGGLYPALAVTRALQRLYPDVTLTFVGARGDMAHDLIAQSGVTFDHYHTVLAGPLHGVSRGQQAFSALKIAIGIVQSALLVIRRRPQALFLTGGWVGFPVAVACWLLRRPIVIYVPDIEPGLALRLQGRYLAHTIAATVADTAQYFPGKNVVETGYPLRPELVNASREAGIARLGLDPTRKMLIVFGGSRGSRSLNTTLVQIGPALLADGLQIVHITGTLDWDQVQAEHAQLSDAQKQHYRIFPYLSDIGPVFAAADLVVSRAGASSLAESPALEVPAILVPYPYAWRYQKVNADWLASRGAAVRLDDERLADELLPTIRALFSEPGRLEGMRAALRGLRRTDGADNIARLLVRTAGGE